MSVKIHSTRCPDTVEKIHNDVMRGKSSLLRPHVNNIPSYVVPCYNSGLDKEEADKYNMRWAEVVENNETSYAAEYDVELFEIPFSMCLVGEVNACRFLYCLNPAHGSYRTLPPEVKDDADILYGVAAEARQMVELDMHCDTTVLADALEQWGYPVFDDLTRRMFEVVTSKNDFPHSASELMNAMDIASISLQPPLLELS